MSRVELLEIGWLERLWQYQVLASGLMNTTGLILQAHVHGPSKGLDAVACSALTVSISFLSSLFSRLLKIGLQRIRVLR